METLKTSKIEKEKLRQGVIWGEDAVREADVAYMEKDTARLEKKGVREDIPTLILLPQTVSISVTDLKNRSQRCFTLL